MKTRDDILLDIESGDEAFITIDCKSEKCKGCDAILKIGEKAVFVKGRKTDFKSLREQYEYMRDGNAFYCVCYKCWGEINETT